jgi:hypothetical protein
MRYRGLIVVLLATLVLAVTVAPALAQQYPDVSSLKPFSPEANFMSLPGYLRWLIFQQTGQWITYAEASRIVQEQLSAAGR